MSPSRPLAAATTLGPELDADARPGSIDSNDVLDPIGRSLAGLLGL